MHPNDFFFDYNRMEKNSWPTLRLRNRESPQMGDRYIVRPSHAFVADTFTSVQ